MGNLSGPMIATIRHFGLTTLLVLSLAGPFGHSVPRSSGRPVRVQGDLVPFGLCMSGMPVDSQIESSRRIGYGGLGLAFLEKERVRRIARHPEVASGRFRIPSMIWWASVEQPLDTSWLDPVLEDAGPMRMDIWMVADGKDKSERSRSKAVEMYARAASRCKAKGVRLVIYPHIGCVVETAEEAAAIRDSLAGRGHPEVRISILLCHELKAGNRDRLPEIVRRLGPMIALASISGADHDDYRKAGDFWGSVIKPLDQGTYDVGIFLEALAQAGYGGPLLLHTYNLPAPDAPSYDKHLERSWNKWLRLKAPWTEPDLGEGSPGTSTTVPRR